MPVITMHIIFLKHNYSSTNICMSFVFVSKMRPVRRKGAQLSWPGGGAGTGGLGTLRR